MRYARTARYASAMPCDTKPNKTVELCKLILASGVGNAWVLCVLLPYVVERPSRERSKGWSGQAKRCWTLSAGSWRRSAASTGLRQEGHAAARPCRSWNSTVRRMQDEQTAEAHENQSYI